MTKKIQLAILLVWVHAAFLNCITSEIRWTTVNTNAPLNGKFQINYQVTDAQQSLAAKILSVKLKQIGFTETKGKPDYYFNLTSLVFPRGNIKHIMANAIGNNMVMMNSSSSPRYTKSLNITINDKNKTVLWTGSALEEEAQCGELNAVMPEIITALFENYPKDQMNKNRFFYLGDSEVAKIKKEFPDASWGCY
ncbi:DUF4136 domain-containing protein [Leptospira semungkisensis]|uniref:DUF4136 domain-containing protein n=1 Tax=Leptospira semungkisensis TaxID=2484985 RepID=A0A4R9G7S4_9LEPT|nr:DUF4136 domain-containing protein [Leptospira semungkisensis]TGK07686.1 DUF4136 domain-containing protein [Leptospira semungkisensis]